VSARDPSPFFAGFRTALYNLLFLIDLLFLTSVDGATAASRVWCFRFDGKPPLQTICSLDRTTAPI